MNSKSEALSKRGATWFGHLAANANFHSGYPPSILVADADLDGQSARYIAVIPDPNNRFARARSGEVGLLEGWHIARAVDEIVKQDQISANKTPIVAIVDVVSQAYGRREEAYGIHVALAAAAGAYATARLAGHPVIALLVGKAMSGAFLAHGYQANRIIAINDPEVMVHAMGKESAAKITMRSVEALESLASTIPPMAYDIQSFASLGLLSKLVSLNNPDQPDTADIERVQESLRDALKSIVNDNNSDLSGRLTAPNRQATRTVRRLLQDQWGVHSNT
ncbi:biotin-independent malonate decarboxylase subunit gamma [Solimicrobium silvestre]|uniref:Malonate decarboxylase, gamma subunit n=1 Tax=Solimicrobium silvestre TaxID=2099400 RepID=A0A2S9H418_9BURK|nr:biotin-independent malonate decarboxylase subunit gamma [Solimicrobium silvestre]PRC94722.1 Malonate decarboxylase, gamma subunit [Solimicrobium silvestre]